MVVTKPVRTFTLLTCMAVLMVGYQNCAVDLSGTTPGASTFNCAPAPGELVTFKDLEQNTLISTGALPGGKGACGSCHLEGGQGSGRFSMKENGIADPAVTLANYCTTAIKGAAGMNIVFDAHKGTFYDRSDVQDLADFIANYLQ